MLISKFVKICTENLAHYLYDFFVLRHTYGFGINGSRTDPWWTSDKQWGVRWIYTVRHLCSLCFWSRHLKVKCGIISYGGFSIKNRHTASYWGIAFFRHEMWRAVRIVSCRLKSLGGLVVTRSADGENGPGFNPPVVRAYLRYNFRYFTLVG